MSVRVMKRIKTKIIAVLLAIVVLTLAWGYQRVERFADSPLQIQEELIFTLPAGTRRTGLQELLVEQQLINSGQQFAWLLRFEPGLAEFKAGTYRFPVGMTVRQMLQLLRSGKEAQFTVRLVEGLRLTEWLTVLQDAPYMKHELFGKNPEQVAQLLAIKETSNAEGWFYPDSYSYTAGNSDVSVLKRANLRMVKTVDALWQDRDKGLPYKTPEEMLTMASIIEKETAQKDERPLVAAVFINRLRQGMRLQTDPTVIYGMGKNYNGTLTKKDLETATPYNTYVISGLPPTPIAIPSDASLDAAAHPASSDYLYFVANGQGGHTFSTNLESHNKAVQIYRQGLKNKDAK
jgi:UPF0755 protein